MLQIDNVTALLNSLYDCETFSKTTENATNQQVVAVYKNDDSEAKFAIACDLAFANSLGAALTRIPPGTAADATSNGEVPENIAENLHEVLNICSSIFEDLESNRVTLDTMYLPNQDRCDELKTKLESSKELLQLEYELDRYQAGQCSLLELS